MDVKNIPQTLPPKMVMARLITNKYALYLFSHGCSLMSLLLTYDGLDVSKEEVDVAEHVEIDVEQLDITS